MDGRTIVHTRRSKKQQQKEFLNALGETASTMKACKKSKVPRQNIYDWLKSDLEFKEQYKDAWKLALWMLEDEAVRCGVERVKKNINYKGEKIDEIREYSDTMLTMLLKARAPEKFKERIAQKHSGKNSAPIDFSISNLPNLTREELLKFATLTESSIYARTELSFREKAKSDFLLFIKYTSATL